MDGMDSCSSDFEDEGCGWREERREPLGAAKDCCSDGELDFEGPDRLRALEDEQEALSSSLFSLTSHLAQVQFRLRQIVDAPPHRKEEMLRSLEEFTFRGVPDLGSILPGLPIAPGAIAAEPAGHPPGCQTCPMCHRLDEKVKDQRLRQLQFIERLKRQLKELEAMSEDRPPECATEKQIAERNVIIDNLKKNIDRSLQEAWQQPLTAEELRHQAVCGAAKKEDSQDVVAQLQAQVEDMQRFINFIKNGENLPRPPARPADPKPKPPAKGDELRTETVNLMKKIVSLLQMFAVAQFGCTSEKFQKNGLKRTNIINHWGDLRARLEMSVDAVLNLLRHGDSRTSALGDYDSDSEENTIVLQNVPLAIAVRKHLAINIRNLVQHGLVPLNEMNSLVPFVGCFPRRSHQSKQMHAWELVLRYYEMSNGELYNSTPARKLSQSFNLDIVGGTAVSNKESMLSAIGAIVASHRPYKRSYDSHFKAFVCAALNRNKLVAWLNVIFKNKMIMKMFYSPTSYAANTGFQDSLQSLDRLTPYKFDLPVDLAVRQFQNIKDVFM